MRNVNKQKEIKSISTCSYNRLKETGSINGSQHFNILLKYSPQRSPSDIVLIVGTCIIICFERGRFSSSDIALVRVPRDVLSLFNLELGLWDSTLADHWSNSWVTSEGSDLFWCNGALCGHWEAVSEMFAIKIYNQENTELMILSEMEICTHTWAKGRCNPNTLSTTIILIVWSLSRK